METVGGRLHGGSTCSLLEHNVRAKPKQTKSQSASQLDGNPTKGCGFKLRVDRGGASERRQGLTLE